jgi:uncharacterized repeat protein (TIGR03803 family)
MTKAMQYRTCGPRERTRAANTVLALVLLLMPVVLATQSAQAQALEVLYTFRGGTDGANPYAGLIQDAAGNLYGTTASGGAFGFGTVFKLDTTGTESVLHSFTGTPDGSSPYAGLLRDTVGNLFGTTNTGGSGQGCSSGCGTVFKLDTPGKETVLHSFTGAAYEYEVSPLAGLIRDPAGNLYGTTAGLYGACLFQGRWYYCGTVFKLNAAGNATLLFRFSGGAYGAIPYAGLVRDAAGNLYGTTVFGGAYPYTHGTVFKLDTTGKETVLHSFTGGADGANPYAGLIQDAAGNLYGTTASGGASGSGTVFKLDTTGKETVLHSFTGGADGANPHAGLILDAAGSLYGTTTNGGASGFGTGSS